MIKAFIFDLDGVITDTAEYHYLAWKQLGKDLGISKYVKIYEENLGNINNIAYKWLIEISEVIDIKLFKLSNR